MQSLSDDERNKVLGEVLADELKTFHELVKDVPKMSRKVDKIDGDVEQLKNDVKTVKAAVTDQTKQLKDHELRITELETA